jgi:hypothetical protein
MIKKILKYLAIGLGVVIGLVLVVGFVLIQRSPEFGGVAPDSHKEPYEKTGHDKDGVCSHLQSTTLYLA